MITPEIQDRLAKVYELVKRGATEGEKAAAKKAFDRLVAKYSLEDIDVNAILKKRYAFRYATLIDMKLLVLIIKALIEDVDAYNSMRRDTRNGKIIVITLDYFDWITVDAAYGYFKPHMRKQWKKLCLSQVKRKRKAKTQNKRRTELQDLFFDLYAIKSGLFKDTELVQVDANKMSDAELRDRMLLESVEGGKYNRQMTNGFLLGN